eukprot:CAMPEP_0185020694 /NCGR_PEP_ID=MMETSP1103-20130426/3325_1 /TAXON_ID=36769 /ORGANISM="Paraphysomonas bandaiensis, Strain Caron Lab Isolate" /LENGTH=1580 /DNA_ID=CAMNT_0027551749 /DNA_START=34 /DNA_END=4776 /DNA_ORIENTATION=-
MSNYQYGSERGGDKEDRGVVPQFNENNVEQWIKDFETFLMRKEQSEVAVEPPPKESDFGEQPLTLMEEKSYRQAVKKYWKANAIAYSYCREAVQSSSKALQKFHLLHKGFKADGKGSNRFKAHIMIDELKKCFAGGKQNKISELLTQYGSFRMRPEETAKDYIIRFEILLKELQEQQQDISELSKITRLREGLLNEEYAPLNVALYLMPDDVDYATLSRKIERYDDTIPGRIALERKRKKVEELNFIEKSKRSRTERDKRKKGNCRYCRKEGIPHSHSTEQCRRKQRKKDGEISGQRPGSAEYTGCRNCKSLEHLAADCPTTKKKHSRRGEKGKNHGRKPDKRLLTVENIRRGEPADFSDEDEANMIEDVMKLSCNIHETNICSVNDDMHYTYIDTCCSSSMFLMNDVTMLDTHMNTSKVINGSKKGSEIHITSVGSRGAWRDIEISDQINRCLCSGRKLNEMGYRFTVWYGIQIYDCNTGELVLEGPMKNGMTAVPTQQLLELPDVSTPSNCEVNLSDRTGEDELELLHRRMGHFNKGALTEAHRRMLFTGSNLQRKHLSKTALKKSCLCSICARSKITRVSFHTKEDTDVKPDISADVQVFLNTPARGDERYVIKLTHHPSRMFWVKGVNQRTKEEVIQFFREVFEGEIRQYKLRVDHYHADGAGELINQELRSYLRSQGCYKHTWSSTDSPEMNAVEERKFRTASEMALAMLLQSGLPVPFWLDAYHAARYTLIRLPTRTDRGYMSPYEYVTGQPPSLKYFRVWGCKTYILTPKADRRKDWDDKSKIGYLVGYSEDKVGYQVYLPATDKVITCVHILTDESIPSRTEEYYAEIDALRVRTAPRPKTVNDYQHLVKTFHIDDEDGLLYKTTRVVERKGVIVGYRSLVTAGRTHIEQKVPIHIEDVQVMTRNTPGYTGYTGTRDASSTTDGRSTSTIPAPESHQEQLVNHGIIQGAPDEDMTQGVLDADAAQGEPEYTDTINSNSTNTLQRVSKRDAEKRKRLRRRLANASVLGEINMIEVMDADVNVMDSEESTENKHVHEPNSFLEAERSPQADEWRTARRIEKKALLRRGVLKIVRRPSGVKLIRCKYVHKLKRDILGNIQKYKARLVALGNLQEKTEEEPSTFAPVVKGITIRLVIAIAFMFHMHVHQLDVSSAFCYANLDEDVYMYPPPDEELSNGWCFKLIKALYGLRASPRQWNRHIDKFIKSMQFRSCVLDTCLYYRWHQGKLTLLLLYVDDIIIASVDFEFLVFVKNKFCQTFEMRDMGECQSFLNIRITRGEDWFKLDQSKYAEKVIQKFNHVMGNSRKNKEAPLPSNAQELLAAERELTSEQEEWVSKFPYRSIIGAILYLALHTRPDLAYAIGLLSRYSSNPTYASCRLAIHLLKYLRGTTSKGIKFSGSKFDLHVFSDADWAGDILTRRSTTGYIVFLCAGAIAWQSKLQTTVVTSSMESEYMAEYAAMQELVWLRGVLRELGLALTKPTPFFMDSKSAKDLSENPVYHKRSKHIQIKYHWVREHVNGRFPTARLIHVSTKDMAADIFTKALSTKLFKLHEETITGEKRSISNEVEKNQKKRFKKG